MGDHCKRYIELLLLFNIQNNSMSMEDLGQTFQLRVPVTLHAHV